MQHRVGDGGRLVVVGLQDEHEALGVGGEQRGQVRHQRQRRQRRRLRHAQRAQQPAQPRGAEAQRLALDAHARRQLLQEPWKLTKKYEIKLKFNDFILIVLSFEHMFASK